MVSAVTGWVENVSVEGVRMLHRKPRGSFVFPVRYKTITDKRVMVLDPGHSRGNKTCKETARKPQRKLA